VANDLIGPMLSAFLECATTSLGRDEAPFAGRSLVAPGGPPAWDDCCDGMVWTRLISLLPSGKPFPQVDSAQQCGVLLWVATIGVGALRCAAVVDDQGVAPTPAILTAEALAVTQDAADLQQAIQCCMTGRTGGKPIKFSRWDPQGPEGGCVGGEWQIVVAVDNCRCPPEEVIG